MGSGKTTAAINYMNEHEECKIIYITPFLDEINNRIIPQCRKRSFRTPDPKDGGSKLASLKRLIANGDNVASTHALFERFDDEVMGLLRKHHYTLIMDEVSNVVQGVTLNRADINVMMDSLVGVDRSTRMCKWRSDKSDYPDSGGYFSEVKQLIDSGQIAYVGDGTLVKIFPVQVFQTFDKVVILTYLFKYSVQAYYFKYYNLSYRNLYVTDDYHFVITPYRSNKKYDYSKLIHICDKPKLNSVGADMFDLSMGGYERKHPEDTLRKNVITFFKHECLKVPDKKVLWTTYIRYREKIADKGFKGAFLECNSRATNAYRDRNCLAYLVNRYLSAPVRIFFNQNGIQIDEDGFALSEMLQWVWRSAIRDGKEIWLYIPSYRMRELLKEWIRGEGTNEN